MEKLPGAGDTRNLAAQDGARGTESFRPGAVRVFAFEGRDASGLWRLSSGGAALLAAARGEGVPGARYRVLAEARPDGGLSFRVLGPAVPGDGGSVPESASPLSLSSLASPPPGIGALAAAFAAALRALAREGLSLRLAPVLAKAAARSGDPEGAAVFLARAAALGLGDGDGLDEAVEAVFGRGDASGGSGTEGGDAGRNGRGDAGSRRSSGGEGRAVADGAGADAWLDAGVLDGPGLGRFLDRLALGPPTSRARGKGAWSFVPFAFELDGVEMSGTLRLQLPEESGGPGCIAATLVAGRARTRWRFRVDFGEGPSPRLSIGRERPEDGALRREAARLAAAHGVASFKILAPGEDPDGGLLPPGADERA